MGRSPQDPWVRQGAATVWWLSHGGALLDIDKATSPLAPDERPTAKSLAGMGLAGLTSAWLMLVEIMFDCRLGNRV